MRKLIAGEFCESYPPLMDGVGQVVRNYEENLSRYFGYDVAVVTTYSTKAEMPDDGERQVIRFPMTPLKRLGAYGITRMPKDIKKRVKDIDYDIIHSHSPFSVGALGAKIARERHIPHVTTFHSQYRKDILGFTHSEFLADVGIKYLMRHYEKADAVVIPNRKSIEVLRSYGYDGDITIIENGTDMKVPSEEEKTAFRKRALTLLGLDAITKPVLLFIGQHRDEKNIPLMIESLRILKERNVDFLMVFVGDGEGRQGYIRKTAEYCKKGKGRVRRPVLRPYLLQFRSLRGISFRQGVFFFAQVEEIAASCGKQFRRARFSFADKHPRTCFRVHVDNAG